MDRRTLHAPVIRPRVLIFSAAVGIAALYAVVRKGARSVAGNGHMPRRTGDPSPGDELTALLWVLAGLLGVLDVAWWFFERVLSP